MKCAEPHRLCFFRAVGDSPTAVRQLARSEALQLMLDVITGGFYCVLLCHVIPLRLLVKWAIPEANCAATNPAKRGNGASSSTPKAIAKSAMMTVRRNVSPP